MTGEPVLEVSGSPSCQSDSLPSVLHQQAESKVVQMQQVTAVALGELPTPQANAVPAHLHHAQGKLVPSLY